ncbi:SDR family NAD(P)-dependent oxidoreductase [Bailinhaonella thermotolerans]|uniref:SDR family NAD(P)-dependent oxidoreductase n=2 Tax=Bailinhaonella thermotolerans TaxID=1070861 RepID=A0A3A3ZXK3_9ACTN|nr:SDR family NAD(P)-dependent oxidoreductase [Bailinhaonella thermotolerans]
MTGKTALITGSTGGIGLETARGLAVRGASVILVGTDPGRARRAVGDVRRSAGHDRVSALTADVTGLDGLARLGSQVAERCDALDVLVNNVGVSLPRRELTADGVEKMFAAHVLAPFTLTHLLLPRLRRAGRARVVNVTGGIPGGPIEPGNLLGERRFLGWRFSHYNHTKTMTMALTARLAGELRGDGVAVNVVYPGHGYTPMNRSIPVAAFPRLYRPIAPLVLKVVAPLFFSDLTRSARSSVHAAASPEAEGVSGAYFDARCRRRPLPASALDERGQRAVWDLCARLSADVLAAAQP